MRFWDHDLGPDQVRLLALRDLDADPVDLTPDPGRALDEAGFAVTPDGSIVVVSWNVPDEPGFPRAQLIAIDTSDGSRRTLADEPYVSYSSPSVSRDGASVVCVRGIDSDYDNPPKYSLWLIDLSSGEGRELVADPDLWPGAPQFSADGSAIFFTADQQGHCPVFRVDVASGEITRVTADGHYANVRVHPDGATLYRAPRRRRQPAASGPSRRRRDRGRSRPSSTRPARPTHPAGSSGSSTTAADGTTIEGWLALPDDASAQTPAPFLLWIHGGPLNSLERVEPGAGTRGCWSPRATPCCCPIRRCRPATART